MTILAPTEEAGPPTLEVIPLLAGLTTAACMALLLVSSLRLPPDLPRIPVAAIHILLIVAASEFGVRVAGAAFRRNIDGVARRIRGTAAWLGPLAVCLQVGSFYAVPVAALVVAQAVSHFRLSEVRLGESAAPGKAVVRQDLFQLLPRHPLSRLRSLICAAGCIEVGLAATANGAVGLGVVFVAIAAAIVGWHHNRQRNTRFVSSGARRLASSGLSLVLAFSLTAVALGLGFGSGNVDGQDADTASNGADGEYWGIFLLPDSSPPSQQLVSPPASRSSLPDKREREPVRIRFDGVYWLFKWPDIKPPPTSFRMRGAPDETRFRSTDSIGLMMEAHQTLPNRVDLSCCNRVELGIRNADTYPGTVEIELILIDSSLPSYAAESLGRVAVDPGASQFGRGRPRAENLSFPVALSRTLESFTEVTIRFHLSNSRSTVSPKIAIDELVLIPY